MAFCDHSRSRHQHRGQRRPKSLDRILNPAAGRKATFGQFGRYGGETHGTFRANLLHVMESEDGRVVSVHHHTGKRNGKQLDVLYPDPRSFE